MGVFVATGEVVKLGVLVNTGVPVDVGVFVATGDEVKVGVLVKTVPIGVGVFVATGAIGTFKIGWLRPTVCPFFVKVVTFV